MLDFRARSRLRRALYAKPTIMLLFIATVFVAHSAWSMYQKSVLAKEKYAASQEKLDKTTQYEALLARDIAALSSLRGQEEEIRERFMVAREGEKVIVITDPEKDRVHTVTVPAQEDDETIVGKLKASIGELGE